MITTDLTAEVSRALRELARAGELPPGAAAMAVAGTWRPPPDRVPGTAPAAEGRRVRPGTYSTSLPLALARLAGRPAPQVAAGLAGRLAAVRWVAAAQVTGPGYLTVTVTPDHLAGLAVRVIAAGPAAADSPALAGMALAAPPLPDLPAARGWAQAWRDQRDAVAGRLAWAAGATVVFAGDGEREACPGSPAPRGPSAGPAPGRRPPAASPALPGPGGERRPGHGSPAPAGPGPVAGAVAGHGTDAVRYALAGSPAPLARLIEGRLSRRRDLDDPFTLVRYAHADAASTGRWALDLGIAAAGTPAGRVSASPARAGGAAVPALAGGAVAGPARVSARLLSPPELDLLEVISWLPERAAAAARRRDPAVLATHLERLAAAWLSCREECPALPFGGRRAPDPARRPGLVSARLTLAAAAQAALCAGLGVLAVAAPDRA